MVFEIKDTRADRADALARRSRMVPSRDGDQDFNSRWGQKTEIGLQLAQARTTISVFAKSFSAQIQADRGGNVCASQSETNRWSSNVAGYSANTLATKLGIKPGMVIHVVNAPRDYASIVDSLPEQVLISSEPKHDVDLVHIFTTSRSELLTLLKTFQSKIKQNGVIWVSWPKKSAGVPSEVTENTVREVALPLGLVDTKVCAVDETWSGLKLVIRKENRR